MFPKVIYQGAESVITQIDEHTITKTRLKKSYRVAELDHKFTTHRARSELKILQKLADSSVRVPKVISNDETTNTLTLEYIKGKQLKDVLHNDNYKTYGEKLAELIANLHNLNMIHADLTTSNIMVLENELVLMDFGLSYNSLKVEDKAVDLHLLHQALTSYHANYATELMNLILSKYTTLANKGESTIERFRDVEKRGRNKH